MKPIGTFAAAFVASALLSTLSTRAQVYYQNDAYCWKGNTIIQNSYRGTALSPSLIRSTYPAPSSDNGEQAEQTWTLKADISRLPQFRSDNALEMAAYNLSLEESLQAIEPDSTFRTGIFWGGVWTRDVSYSILHALAQLHPEVSRISLASKINANNRIVQDTGTGGAWPCSTDRVTWVLAAWELYKVTGDKAWLDRIYPVIRNTIEDDRAVAYDPTTQLMHGETSYLDWREQEYPRWAQPADIYQSEALGTTTVHYMAIRILAEICRLEHQPQLAEHYETYAAQLKEGINRQLWSEQKGHYGIYLYGRNHLLLNDQQETLGEALAILSGVADPERARRITQSVVNEPFGTPCIYPNLKDQPPYHNDATWPFVQGYWMKANAAAGNEEGLMHSIATIYRTAALWLTNQENFVIYNGDREGTQINSPRQLWSVAANLSIVPNIYFGIRYETDGIRFSPFIPRALKGQRSLTGFRFRGATLNLSISGFGDRIKSFQLDGKEVEPFLAGTLTGTHTITIVLNNHLPAKQPVTYALNAYIPQTPLVRKEGASLVWSPIDQAACYRIIRNGEVIETLRTTVFTPTQSGEYQLQALDANGCASFASEPLLYECPTTCYDIVQYARPFDVARTRNAEEMQQADSPSVLISRNENILITISIEIPTDGLYALDWYYANGSGSIISENKCATRLLKVDGRMVGASVFPQRGDKAWNDWGYSNPQNVRLTQGTHIVTLEFAETVENMNLRVNRALLRQLRVTKL